MKQWRSLLGFLKARRRNRIGWPSDLHDSPRIGRLGARADDAANRALPADCGSLHFASGDRDDHQGADGTLAWEPGRLHFVAGFEQDLIAAQTFQCEVRMHERLLL